MNDRERQASSAPAPKLTRYGLSLVVVLSIVGLLATLAYVATLRSMGWHSDRNSGLAIPLSLFSGADDATVMLYVSPNSTRYFASVGGTYEVLLKPWRNFFVQRNIQFKEITKLEELADPRHSVLILPSAVALAESEREAILRFRDNGGNILATSALGARTAVGDWVGYDFVKTLFGVDVTGEVPAKSEARHLNLIGELPFTRSYGVAERIWLGQLGANPLRLHGGRTAGVLTDWARTPDAEKEAGATVVYGEHGPERRHARWVMLGFSEVAWEVQDNDVHRLLANALRWLEHRPAVDKSSWPYPYRAAHVIEMDTEEGFPNARRFAAMMEYINAAATFYCLTSVAIQFPDVVKELAQHHEIGYHGDVHESFQGQAEQAQSKRLDVMRAEMQSIIPDTSAMTGFRAPTEGYDKLTMDLLIRKGFKHHAAGPNSTNARLPFFYPGGDKPGGKALVVLPRTQRDDINLIRAGKNTPELIAQALIEDFDQVLTMGGLGLLSIHTQNFGEGSPLVEAMPGFLDHVNKNRDKVWIAPSGKIADWWNDRERLTYKVAGTRSKLDLVVTITGDRLLPAVALIVANPIANAVPVVMPAKTNTALPAVKALDDLRTALVFSDMRPGTYSYSVTFTED